MFTQINRPCGSTWKSTFVTKKDKIINFEVVQHRHFCSGRFFLANFLSHSLSVSPQQTQKAIVHKWSYCGYYNWNDVWAMPQIFSWNCWFHVPSHSIQCAVGIDYNSHNECHQCRLCFFLSSFLLSAIVVISHSHPLYSILTSLMRALPNYCNYFAVLNAMVALLSNDGIVGVNCGQIQSEIMSKSHQMI